MNWNDILQKCRQLREKFDKSYKCLNTDRQIKDETLNKHLEILFSTLEKIRVILNVNYDRLSPSNKSTAFAFFIEGSDQSPKYGMTPIALALLTALPTLFWFFHVSCVCALFMILPVLVTNRESKGVFIAKSSGFRLPCCIK